MFVCCQQDSPLGLSGRVKGGSDDELAVPAAAGEPEPQVLENREQLKAWIRGQPGDQTEESYDIQEAVKNGYVEKLRASIRDLEQQNKQLKQIRNYCRGPYLGRYLHFYGLLRWYNAKIPLIHWRFGL